MAVNVVGGPLEFDAIINNSQFKRQIDEMQTRLQGLTNTAKKEAAEIDNLVQKTTTAIATYASFAAAKNFIGDIVRTRGEFQQLEVAFNTMLGSKERADRLLAQAVDLAAKTPFTLQEVGQGAKQLLAYGFAADDITKTLSRLGDVASGVGAPLGDIVYLYGTLRTQGRAYTRDIIQFTQRGIPIISELAKQFGIAEKDVLGLVESGKVGFPEVEKAFNHLTDSGGLFFNLMQEQSKTLTGLISNLEDAWSRMLNDFGKSNQGVFTGALQGVTALVNNYQSVLDILKVLIATYGTYRTAIIATSVVQAIATEASKGYTIAETLRYQAMLLSERAMKVLNATMLSNPYVAVATGIAAIVTAMIVFSRTAKATVTSTDLLNASQEKVAEKYAEQQTKLQMLQRQLSNTNVTEQERLSIYQKLKDIDPAITKGIDEKKIAYDQLTKNLDQYIQKLRERIGLEANDDAIKASIKEENKLLDQIKERGKVLKSLPEQSKDPLSGYEADPVKQGLRDEQLKAVQDLSIAYGEQKKVTDDLTNSYQNRLKAGEDVKKQVAETVKVLQESVTTLKEQQSSLSTNSQEWKNYQKQIDDVQKRIEAITGKQTTKELKKELSERGKDIEQFLKDLVNAEDDARQAGKVKEESQLDKINTKYDQLLAKAKELGAGPGVDQRIENARHAETGSFTVKTQAKEYLDSLDEQKAAFEKYESAKTEFGLEASKKLYGGQTEQFNSYLEFLESEIAKNFLVNGNTLEGQLKANGLAKQYADESKRQAIEEQQRQVKLFSDAVQNSMTINLQRLKLDKDYLDQRVSLEKVYTGKELEERQTALKSNYDDQTKELDAAAIREGAIYKKLNADIIGYTRAQLKARVKDLKATLSTNATLTPQQRADIKSYIDQVDGLLDSTNKVVEASAVVAEGAAKISSGFSAAANGVREFDAELADTLDQMSQLVNGISQAATAVGSFASGDILGGITGAISAIGSIVGALGANKKEREKQEAEVKAFQDAIYAGEFEINELYRQRAREQVRINQLRIEGIQKESNLLKQQSEDVLSDYNKVFAELQKQSYQQVVTERTGGNVIPREVLKEFSLLGKTFDEIEQLYIKGQLTPAAKALFEQLEKLKQEGLDVNQALIDNAKEIQEVFTGTTADDITDMIAEGFRNGKRSVADFADDTEDLIRGAMLNALKYQVLQGPIQKLYEKFAADAQSGDGLDSSELQDFTQSINKTIEDAKAFAEQVEKATGVNLSDATDAANQNSLSGAIKGITAEQADLLAGQFGGLRISAIQQLNVASQSLTVLSQIKGDTAYLLSIDKRLKNLEDTGIKLKG